VHHPLTPGIYLEENTFHEDGYQGQPNSEYGHRDHPARLTLDEGPYSETQFSIDRFFLTQETGCSYIGYDRPSPGIPMDAGDILRRTWFLEFEGYPVDTCAGDGQRKRLEGLVHTWRISGQVTAPPSKPSIPKDTKPGRSGPGGTVKSKKATPTKAKTNPSNAYPSGYGGGIDKDAKVGQTFNMIVTFRLRGQSDVYSAPIPVKVVEPTTADFITIETLNDDNWNFAPPSEPEIVIQAHKKIRIERRQL
jgi:hypothetical protein